MQIDKKYKLEKAVSADESRENLQNIWVSKRHAMATNGKILALVPITFDKDDEPGWMSPDALKLGRKVASKGVNTLHIGLNGMQILPDETILKRPSEVHPPRILQILMAAHRNRLTRIGLNAAYLRTLSEAMGCEEVVLEIGKPDQAVLVKPLHPDGSTVGLFMPIRIQAKRR